MTAMMNFTRGNLFEFVQSLSKQIRGDAEELADHLVAHQEAMCTRGYQHRQTTYAYIQQAVLVGQLLGIIYKTDSAFAKCNATSE